ncbi:MAG TPA: ScyD/ScyE family protein [Kineosporiaceae bacterium]|nr:ScyD/ScyE family protein [Kineosporiaceae bacterium]
MTRSRLCAVLLTATVAGATTVATPISLAAAAPGHHSPSVRTLDRSVIAPYQLDYARGSLYVADGGTSRVSRLTRSGLATVADGPTGGEVAGVAVNDLGDVAYTSSVFGEEATTSTQLTIKLKRGGTVTADLLAYEQAHNPDAKVHYGIDNPTECQKQAFEQFGGASTTGLVDSHPYAVAPLGHHGWVVADAGGNDLLKVDRRGRISTLAVLPRQPAEITAEAAAGLGLPDCVVGAVYNFDPVPTDVEVSKHGLIVSLLPGGPEDPSLGARGSVYRVSAASGNAHKIAGGFLGATNVAVAPHGRIFVAELFAGRISVIDHGRVRPYLDLPSALSLTWGAGTLFAGTLAPTDDQGNPSGTGSLVAIR